MTGFAGSTVTPTLPSCRLSAFTASARSVRVRAVAAGEDEARLRRRELLREALDLAGVGAARLRGRGDGHRARERGGDAARRARLARDPLVGVQAGERAARADVQEARRAVDASRARRRSRAAAAPAIPTSRGSRRRRRRSASRRRSRATATRRRSSAVRRDRAEVGQRSRRSGARGMPKPASQRIEERAGSSRSRAG